MERTKEANDEIYISASKQSINKYINANNYKLAFGLLLSVLDRLDDGTQKNDFITDYLNMFFTLSPCNSHLNPR
jgi:hypothetical protein